MARLLRLLTLTVAATATATAAAVGTTALASSAETSLAAGPSTYGAHEAVAPSPLPTAHVVQPRRVAAAPVKAAPKPTAAPRRTHRTTRVAPAAPVVRRAALTPQELLDRAIAKLPGFNPRDARFILKPGLDHWGLTDLGGGIVYISPRVPANRMYDVVVHEWSHVLSMKPYLPDVMSGVNAMDAYFGGTGLVGAERAADCMAKLLGATWTHYTPCNDAHWRAGARVLLSRQAL